MKTLKKVLAVVIVLTMICSLSATSFAAKDDPIKIGISIWSSTDTLGSEVKRMIDSAAETLGVEVEFTEINWDNKILELNGKSIDCIWNGMTLTDGVKAAMETSKPYCGNAQVVVALKTKAEGLDYAKLTFAVEAGSAAEELAQEKGWSVVSLQSQSDALLEVASGASDACIIDQLMAGAMIGEGTSYPDLVQVEGLNAEEYGVGFRKGSDLAAKLDAFLDELYESGALTELAEKYGIDVALIAR